MALNMQLRPVHRALALPLSPQKHQKLSFCQGPANQDYTLKTQGIEGLGAAYYNLIEPDLIGHALSQGKGDIVVSPDVLFNGRDAHCVSVVRK